MVKDRQMLIDQLIQHEGLRLLPYTDTKGKTSIGVGRNLSDKGISNAEAMILLDHDLDEVVADLAGHFPWFVRLDPIRQRAVVDLRFNVGPRGFRSFKKFIRYMAAAQYVKAAHELWDSEWYTQVGDRGGDLMEMIMNGVDAV